MTGHASARPLIISSASPRATGDVHAASCAGGRADGGDAIPELDRDTWRMRVSGACAEPLALGWEQLMELPQVDVQCDLHCSGGHCSAGEVFTGVPARVIIDLVRPIDSARFVTLHTNAGANDEWSVTVALADFTRADSVLAWMRGGHLLTPEQGAPLRAVLPSLARSSSVKWLTGLELRTGAATPGR